MKAQAAVRTEMTLDEFIVEQWKLLEMFRDHWKKMNKENPDQYPIELSPGNWDEQFMFFTPEAGKK